MDNFSARTAMCDSPVKKRCVAEARVIRAWAHMLLASYFGTPPLVDHVLPGDARPTNCDHQVLMDWIIKEFKMACPTWPARKRQGRQGRRQDHDQGGRLAFLGKAQVFNRDYAAAKAPLKRVIDSGNYDLVSGPEMRDLFHKAGDGNEEKVLEMNYVYADGVGPWKYHFQRNQALFFRMFKAYPDVLIKEEGWGNNCAPTKKFVDAMMANEPNSYRRKAWIVSYEELLTDYGKNLDINPDGSPMTKEQKLMDPNRGLDFTKYNDLYANYGWFFFKFMPRTSPTSSPTAVPTRTTIP